MTELTDTIIVPSTAIPSYASRSSFSGTYVRVFQFTAEARQFCLQLCDFVHEAVVDPPGINLSLRQHIHQAA